MAIAELRQEGGGRALSRMVDIDARRLARGLAWFGIGLGLAQLLAPKRVARASGLYDHSYLPAFGVREIASGIGILARARPSGWLWARVAGDVVDLAVLGGAFATHKRTKGRLAVAAAAVAGVALLDVLCAARMSNEPRRGR
ncbi:MAG: hypothetical protein IRZ04_04460 [Rhodospirillales bacterium]|nr:hypothetical protein [Rhodospirillales bacterium]